MGSTCPGPKGGLRGTLSEKEDEGLNMQAGLPLSASETSAACDMDETWREERKKKRDFPKATHTFQHRSLRTLTSRLIRKHAYHED